LADHGLGDDAVCLEDRTGRIHGRRRTRRRDSAEPAALHPGGPDVTMVELEPQPRIDTIVRLPGGGDARRTEYVGTAWFDGKPFISGLTLQRSPNAPRGFRRTTF